MNVQDRIRISMLVERINKREEEAKKAGIQNTSTFKNAKKGA